MTKTIIQTVVSETQDYTVLEVFDEIGNEWATNITFYIVECKHCNHVQHGNSGNIHEHLEIWHDDVRVKFESVSNYLKDY